MISKSKYLAKKSKYLAKIIFFWKTQCLSRVTKWFTTIFLNMHSEIYFTFGWLTKVYVWKRSGPSNVILHRFCLTKGSTLISQSHYSNPWFMYQNRLGPSGGIYHPNFVPCFVYHQLNYFCLSPGTASLAKAAYFTNIVATAGVCGTQGGQH